MPRRFPAPWTVTDTGSSFAVSDASGMTMVWFCYGKDLVGTNPERLDREDAWKLARGFARLPEQLRLAPDEREALSRFMATRPDIKTEAEAMRVLIRDALIGIGDLPLGSKDRGPGARRTGK